MFFSVYEKKSDRLLIGFAGEPLESADDEFKLRLHDTSADTIFLDGTKVLQAFPSN